LAVAHTLTYSSFRLIHSFRNSPLIRNDNDLNSKHRAIVSALSALPDEAAIDGEIVALDESVLAAPCRSFNTGKHRRLAPIRVK
jgi:hypothetical protein